MFRVLWQKLTGHSQAEALPFAPLAATGALSEAQCRLEASGLLTAHHGFAFTLWQALLNQQSQANLFFSPLSLSVLLALLAQGASGQSRQELLSVLGLSEIAPEPLLTAYATLLGQLQVPHEGVDLDMAQSLWLPQSLALAPDFARLATDVFQAQTGNLNFGHPAALATINAWAREKTRGLIEQILTQLSPDTQLVLLNAIYFKGRWQMPFQPEATRPEPFDTPTGRIEVPTLIGQMDARYAQIKGKCQILALSYGPAAVASFYALLPEPGSSPAHLLRQLSPASWAQWRAQMYEQRVNVHLPRFRMAWEAELNQTLKELGLEHLFTADAEFEGLLASADPLLLSLIRHKSLITVDETGTEAAAVTVMLMRQSGMPKPPPELRLNRPFLFLIVDESSGSILFAGALQQPES